MIMEVNARNTRRPTEVGRPVGVACSLYCCTGAYCVTVCLLELFR